MSDDERFVALLEEQLQLKAKLDEIYNNFMAILPENLTQAIQNKALDTLATTWNQFKDLDTEIQKLDIPRTDPYFTLDALNKQRVKIHKYHEEMERIQIPIVKADKTKQGSIASEAQIRANDQRGRFEKIELRIKLLEAELVQTKRVLQESQPGPLKIQYLKENIEKHTDIIDTIQAEITANAFNVRSNPDYLHSIYGKIEGVTSTSRAIICAMLDQLDLDQSTAKDKALSDSQDDVKLAPLEIPKFNGDEKQWQSFHDLFTKMVHENDKYSAIKKFMRLKGLLVGDASNIFSQLPVTNDNYETAWGLLLDRYNNPRAQLNRHLEAIVAIQKISKSAESVRQFTDKVKENIRAIKILQPSFEICFNAVMIMIIREKLDYSTALAFEQSLQDATATPTMDELERFLKTRALTMDGMRNPTTISSSLDTVPHRNVDKYKKHTCNVATPKSQPARPVKRATQSNCPKCNGQHNLSKCPDFQKLTVPLRWDFVTQKQLCRNCMCHHYKDKCRSKFTCFTCKKTHHSMLHKERVESFQSTTATQAKPENSTQKAGQSTVNVSLSSELDSSDWNVIMEQEKNESYVAADTRQEVLLPTALAQVCNTTRGNGIIRILIDSGSKLCLVTRNAVKMLGIPEFKSSVHINGVGGTSAGTSRTQVTFIIKSLMPTEYKIAITAQVMSTLTALLPSINIPFVNRPNISNLVANGVYLADPTYHQMGPVDMILGSDYLPQLLRTGVIKLNCGPILQETYLGWIISGPIQKISQSSESNCNIVIHENLTNQMERFFVQEEMPVIPLQSSLDIECERRYNETTVRDKDGRFQVTLIFDQSKPDLGESRRQALARWFQVETRLTKNPLLREHYNKFMAEYLVLGHMERAQTPASSDVYYLPHHVVIKEDSLTTKYRVVFDGSAKTTNGKSLNEQLLTGPRLQDNIFDIMARWRIHKIAFTADIEKMYRQIKVNPEQLDYQRILFRFSEKDPVQEYRLKTVTYGTSSAPFLAIKTLQTLARDEAYRFPEAAKATLDDFYVDDLFSGEQTVKGAVNKIKQISALTRAGGFTLMKWASNHPQVLAKLPTEAKLTCIYDIIKNHDGNIKTLGLQWNPLTDEFTFKVNYKQATIATRRTVLSGVASIYDPIGWLSPVIIEAKMIMQEAWTASSSWDEELPTTIVTRWRMFEQELKAISEINIPRWIGGDPAKMELIGYCDSSEKAYAAVIYARINVAGVIKVTLLSAKTRVAPLKNPQTLPRLELLGASLLADLVTATKKALRLSNDTKLTLFTDSMIVLGWLRGDPARWNIFVRNKINNITSQVNAVDFAHVRSEDNPADCASRGISATKLKYFELWWKGPRALLEVDWQLSEMSVPCPTIEVRTKGQSVNIAVDENEFSNQFSTFLRFQRVTGYCRRWLSKEKGELTPQELLDAHDAIIRKIQMNAFPAGIKEASIANLSPIRGPDQLLRVGGRLEKSELSDAAKHPIILPKNTHLNKLLIMDAHKNLLHGGTRAVDAYLRSRYWMIGGTVAIKKQLKQCMTCHKYKAKVMEQLMGQLPQARTRISPCFYNTMVDFCGPINVRMSQGRGNKSFKGYVAIFVCLGTKSIHLEVVSSLTSEAFMASLKRFTSRRSTCGHIWSDNGTNFVGSNRLLEEDVKTAIAQATKFAAIQLANQGITWHFSPGGSPHFQGLVERAVQSFKFHFYRVTGNTTLTFEEMSTVTAQIEAVLNSRPLCPMTADPEDVSVLTPGHFLVGRPLVLPVEPSYANEIISPLKRWKLVQQIVEEFWTKWSEQYLSTLQIRNKWNTVNNNVAVGELVLLKHERQPSARWSKARVVEVHPGKDGFVRAATIKTAEITANGEVKTHLFKRPIAKLCRLPMQQCDELDEHTIPESEVLYSTAKAGKPRKPRRPRNQRNRVYSKKVCLLNPVEAATTPSSIQLCPNEAKRHYLKRKTTWTFILGTIFMLWLTVNATKAQTITPFTAIGGVFIAHESNVWIQRGWAELHINTSMNMTSDLEMLNDYQNKFIDMCVNLTILFGDSHCNHRINHTQTQLAGLQAAMKLNIKTRHPRSVFKILRELLFGEDTEQAIERLDNRIDKAEKTTCKLLINYAQALGDAEHRTDNRLNRLGSKLNSTITTMNDNSHQLIGYMNDLQTHQQISDTFTLFEAVIAELVTQYSTLQSSNILTEEEWSNKTSVLKTQLRPETTIMDGLYGKCEKEILQINNSLIISIKIPIVSTHMYEELLAIPIPEQSETTPKILNIARTNKICINMETMTYFYEPEKIYKINTTAKIATQPIVMNALKTLDCLAATLMTKHQYHNICTSISLQEDYEEFFALPGNGDNYAFYTSNNSEVIKRCGDSRMMVPIKMGIINLEAGCSIMSKKYVIYGTSNIFLDKGKILMRPMNLSILGKFSTNEHKFNLSTVTNINATIEKVSDDSV